MSARTIHLKHHDTISPILIKYLVDIDINEIFVSFFYSRLNNFNLKYINCLLKNQQNYYFKVLNTTN